MTHAKSFRRTLLRKLLVAGGASAAALALAPLEGCGDSTECFEWDAAEACPDRDDAKQYIRVECEEKVSSVDSDGERDGAKCCYEVTIDDVDNACCPPGCVEGRPLTVDGQPLLAPVCEDQSWLVDAPVPTLDGLCIHQRELLAAAWTRAALAEHGSIASFALAALQLMALGAPPELVSGAQRAGYDEVRHARDAFALASAYRGTPVGPGPLALPSTLDLNPGLKDVAVATTIEGCINETIAAVLAAEQLTRATDPAVRAALQCVAEDEAQHTALAWRTVSWAVRIGGAPVRQAVLEALSNIDVTIMTGPRRTGDLDEEANASLARHGWLDHASRRKAIEHAIEEVIRPCADTLFAELDADREETPAAQRVELQS